MATPHPPTPVLLILAASSRYTEALNWAQEKCQQEFGGLAMLSEAFDFQETDYYAQSMGSDLKKQFFAAEQLIDPGQLAAIKRLTNNWEAEYAQLQKHEVPRPLNLDPGYITLAKLVLASTKDHVHRIYLGQRIYAEITLTYRHHAWQPQVWTYPDYQRADYQEFFSRCRLALRERTRR